MASLLPLNISVVLVADRNRVTVVWCSILRRLITVSLKLLSMPSIKMTSRILTLSV